jgi:hypothetical protein
MTASYDRQPEETPKAYAAFTVYRNMGATRSLERVAAEIYPPEIPQKPPRNISQIERWSSLWDWIDRCRDFDRDEELLRRERQREKDRADHDQKLEEYRSQNEHLGRGYMELGERLLEILNLTLDPIAFRLQKLSESQDPNARIDKADLEVLKDIATSGKSGITMVAKASTVNADGLLIRQLMEKLREGE